MGTSVYVLTGIGESYASNISQGEPSDALKLLYFARRRGGKFTTDQIENFVIQDKWQAQQAIRKLSEMQAIKKVA